MVIKQDGSKWACRTCLLGHRVSRCDHTDRDLLLVPRKGRPVSQCQHCRTEREGRSAHVKCECGAKPFPAERCFSRHKARSELTQFMPNDCLTGEQHCCCPHGGKCICINAKKEQLKRNDTIQMKDSHTLGSSTRGEILPATRKSEAQVEVSINHRYKPLQSTIFAHGQAHLSSNAPHQADTYHEQITASPYEGSSSRAQVWSQAWPDFNQAVIPNIDNSLLSLSLLEQDSSHFLNDHDNPFAPLHDQMPSADTSAGMLDTTYQGFANVSPTTIAPPIGYPTSWPMEQFSAMDWTGHEDLDQTRPEVTSGAMRDFGLLEEDTGLAITEHTNWAIDANLHKVIDPTLQIDFDE